MADRNLSRAHVGLALASALVVLLASVVAISRLGDRDDDGVSTSAPGATSSTAAAESLPADPGAATGADRGSSGAGQPGSSDGATQGAGAADALATAAGAGSPADTNGDGAVRRSGAAATGSDPNARYASTSPERPASPEDSVRSADGSADGSQGGGPGGGQPSGGGGQPNGGGGQPGGHGGGGGQEAPPQPSQDRPEQKPLLAASASVGQGAEGGVVGLTLDGGGPQLDVTVGTDQVVGNHPPSQGTGIDLGGRLVNPGSAVPLPPG